MQPPYGAAVVNRRRSLATDLAACYLMNEPGGPILYDAIRGAYNVTLTGLPARADGLVFSGTEYGTSLTVPISAYPFTLGAWFKSSYAGTAYQTLVQILSRTDTDIDYRIATGPQHQGALWARNRTPYSTLGAAELTDGNWHLIVGVFLSATNRDLYVDGTQDVANENNTSVDLSSYVDGISLGRSGDTTPDQYFSGRLGMAAIWTRALAAGEIRDWFQSPYGMLRPAARRMPYKSTQVAQVPTGGVYLMMGT